MRRAGFLTAGAVALLALAAFPALAQPSAKAALEAASTALAPGGVKSVAGIQYVVSGTAATPTPSGPWIETTIPEARITMSYTLPGRRSQNERIDAAGKSVKAISAINGKAGWVESAVGVFAAPLPDPEAVALRTRFIWGSPHGVIWAATLAAEQNPQAVALSVKDGKTTLSFVWNGEPTRVVLNRLNLPEAVLVDITDPVLGKIVGETHYSGYRDWGGGVFYPSVIIQRLGGRIAETLAVSAFVANPPASYAIPESLRAQCGGSAASCR